MKKAKKILLTAGAYILTAALAIGGTVAYLQSEDSDVNVMTLGNVKIEQHEYQRAENVAHNAGEAGKGNGVKEGALVPFKQGQALYPAVPANGAATDYSAEATDLFYWGDYVYSGTAGNGLWNDNKLSNVMDKMVFVENTGKSDAYFRTIIAFECPEGMEYSEGADKEFMMNINGGSTYEWESIGYTEIDGVRYLIEVATYQSALKPGNQSHPSLLQVVMTHNATNEDMEKLGDSYDIIVLSQAVQAAGFDGAATALDTAFGDVTEVNAAEWLEKAANLDWVEADGKKAQLEGEAAKEVLESLEEGKDLIVDEEMDIVVFDTNNVDAKDATVNLNGTGSDAYGYLAFVPDAKENVTVENLNVTGSGFVEVGHYGQGGGEYVLNNVKIENLAATLANGDKGFTLGCAFMGFGDTTLNDCVITGTTAKDGVIPVDLACGQAWSGYKDNNDNKVSTTVNGGEYGKVYCWSHGITTINGAKIDNIQVAPINGSVTIKAGSEIEKIVVDYGTSTPNKTRLSKLVIEDGATIGEIVFGVNTYTVAEWNAYVASL